MINKEFVEKYLKNPMQVPPVVNPADSTLDTRATSFDSDVEADVERLITQIEASRTDITPDYDSWLRALFALSSEFGENGREYAHRVSRFYPGYTRAECDKQYTHCLESEGSGITIRSLFFLGKEHGILVYPPDTDLATSPLLSTPPELLVVSDEVNLKMSQFENLKMESGSEILEPDQTDPVDLNHKTLITDHQSLITTTLLPFPVDVFPAPVARFIRSAASSIGCPPDFLGVPILASMATAIGTSRSLLVKKGWEEGARFYTSVVALPGTKKSPALKMATQPIRAQQGRYSEDFDDEKESYNLDMASYDIDMELWKKKKPEEKSAEDQPRIPEEPKLRQVKTSNATMEAIGRLLDGNPRGILFEQDELAAWVKSMNAYRSGKGSDVEDWLSFWNGSQVIINRVSSKGAIILNNPLVNVTGCIQPDLLNELSGIKQNGFFDRILISFPEPEPLTYSTDELPDEVALGYNRVFERLFALTSTTDHQGKEVPLLMMFSPEARTEWEQWNRRHVDEVNSPDMPYYLMGVWSKLQAYTARMSLVLQLAENASQEGDTGEGREISRESVVKAEKLSDYFKSQLRKVYRTLYNSEMDRKVELAYAWIVKQGGKASARMLRNNNIGNCKNAAQVNELMIEMEERSLGIITRKSPPHGGPVSSWITLNAVPGKRI